MRILQTPAAGMTGERKVSVRRWWSMLVGKGETRRLTASRILLVFLALFVLAGLGLGGVYAHWALFDHRFSVVSEGKVYCSAEMPTDDLLKTVRRHDLRAVIDLRRQGDNVLAEHSALTGAGIKHFHLPSSQVPTDETIDKFLEIVDHAENRPLLIHCKHGQGRAVLFSAAYRIEFEGWSRERAWRATRFLPFKGSFAPDRRKGKFLLNYIRRRDPSTVVGGAEVNRTLEHSGTK